MALNLQSGLWLKLRLAVIVLVVGYPGQAAQAANPFAMENLELFGSNIINDLPETFLSDANVTFSKRDNVAALLIATGAGIAMHESDADRNIYENMQRHRGFNHFADETFDYAGSPGTHFAATGLWYLFSIADKDELNTQRAWTMLSALSISGSVTLGLKAIVHNDAPNGTDWAWPSGHTASSFTVASVLDEFYGPKVGIPAYVLASVVAWRMMDSGDHWASDVVFGGTLGWVVGHTVAGKHKLEIAGFQVMPCLATTYYPAVGVTLVKQF
jgi:membrane-associated phospholipid phosphatase